MDGAASGGGAGFENVGEGGLAGESEVGVGMAPQGEGGGGADFGEGAETGDDEDGGGLLHGGSIVAREDGGGKEKVEENRHAWRKIDMMKDYTETLRDRGTEGCYGGKRLPNYPTPKLPNHKLTRRREDAERERKYKRAKELPPGWMAWGRAWRNGQGCGGCNS